VIGKKLGNTRFSRVHRIRPRAVYSGIPTPGLSQGSIRPRALLKSVDGLPPKKSDLIKTNTMLRKRSSNFCQQAVKDITTCPKELLQRAPQKRNFQCKSQIEMRRSRPQMRRNIQRRWTVYQQKKKTTQEESIHQHEKSSWS
jgi:hypothetical protein